MTYKIVAFLAASALSLDACQPGVPAATDNPKQLMHNDFEQSVGWGGVAEGPLTTAKAHSGHWAASRLCRPSSTSTNLPTAATRHTR